MSNLPTFVPDELRLSSDDSYLLGVQQRQQQKIVPSQGSNGYRYEGTNQIEFNWSHGDATDLATTLLVFNWKPTTGNNTTLDASASVAMASDVIDRVEFYIDSTEVLSSTNTQISVVQNILMFSEFPADYFEREGTMLMGHSSQLINPSHNTTDGNPVKTLAPADSSSSGADGRVFCVPLWALHNGFAQAKVCPVLGSNMRIVLHLNKPEDVLNTRSGLGSSYVLNNVYLLEDRLILTPDYKASLMSAIRSEEGFKINFVDYDITAHNITNSDTEHLVVRNDHSNALSLILFNKYLPAWRADVSGGDTAEPDVSFVNQASYPNMDVDLAKRTNNLKVECGSLRFTGLRGSESIAEHFSHIERANGSLAKASETGCFEWYNYASSKAGKLPKRRTGHLNTVVNFSPLVVSLEKTMLADNDSSIVNRGLNSTDPMASRDVEVSLQFPNLSKLNNQRERLFSTIVYEKALVMRNGQITIEH
jgi:hypothetical protein